MFKQLNKNILLIIFFISILYSMNNGTSTTHHQCVHKEANGTIIINNQTIMAELYIPAISVLGFETFSNTKKEKNIIKKAISSLKQTNLLTFFEKKGWFKANQKITLEQSKNTVELKNKGNHAEFKITRHYKQNPTTIINIVSTSLFSKTSHLDYLNLNVITDQNQAHYKLSSNKPKITL